MRNSGKVGILNNSFNEIHETGHLIGFDERYESGGGDAHKGFENDPMGNANMYSPSSEFGNTVKPKWHKEHFNDILKYALKIKDKQENIPMVYTGSIDNTEKGNKEVRTTCQKAKSLTNENKPKPKNK